MPTFCCRSIAGCAHFSITCVSKITGSQLRFRESFAALWFLRVLRVKSGVGRATDAAWWQIELASNKRMKLAGE